MITLSVKLEGAYNGDRLPMTFSGNSLNLSLSPIACNAGWRESQVAVQAGLNTISSKSLNISSPIHATVKYNFEPAASGVAERENNSTLATATAIPLNTTSIPTPIPLQ